MLNSKLLRLYVIETELLRKGEKATPHIGVKGLNSIPIPTVNKTISKPIIKLVDKILEIKSKNPTQDISKIENEIDKIVYKIYGIDETEIKIIEAK